MWCLPASATNLFSLRKLHSSKENVVSESISQLTNFPVVLNHLCLYFYLYLCSGLLFMFSCVGSFVQVSRVITLWFGDAIFSWEKEHCISREKILHLSRKNIAFLEEGNDKDSGQLRFGTTCVVWDWHLCVGGTYTYIVKYDSWIAPNPFPKHWRANRSKTQIQALKKQKRFPGFCLIHDTLTLNVFFLHFSFLLRNHDL